MTQRPLTAGFMVIHGNQPELLRQLLVDWFKAHPLAPLEDETLLVQSNGMAQWLKLALAANADEGGCGIAASLEMLLPSRFVWQAYRAVLGHAAVPETSPFDKPLLIWRLMRLLPSLTGQPGYEPLARFLADDHELRKRHQLAEKIADLFDQYQVYRADWLAAWSQGQDVLIDAHGTARPLAADQCWQAMLWRALLEDVVGTEGGNAAGATSRAAVHEKFLQVAQSLQERPADLPRRISVFGLSSLPRQSLEVLLAIARFSQVILCVNNPCEHYWADLLSAQEHARRAARMQRQRQMRHARKPGAPAVIAEENLHLHTHPLLAAWGRQGRDYIALLDELDEPERYRALFAQAGQRIDLFESTGTDNLLRQLQDDIRLLRPAHESLDLWPPVDPAQDRSIRFHIAHSTQREVEILHDQLLAAFNADPTLRPRDVIVMVPDVNAYAPHIEAVFGQLDRTDERFIPFSIADQATRHQAPLAFALEFLLGLPESRLAVSDLLDLLDVPALRQRFGIDADDLPLLHRWIRQTHIRWGLNAAHRERFIARGEEQNTWLLGLKQMLLGYAVGSDPTERDDCAWHDIEPYGEVSGLDAALVGPLAALLLRLETLATDLATPAAPATWDARLQALLQNCFACDTPDDSFLLLQLQASLRAWVDACAAAGLSEAIPLAVIREHWLAQIDQTNLARRFMAGKLTFATLMPMRAIPFRIVCLLGMNDGEFPRSRPPVDFDLMARDLRPGDRSRREDDRYLFLEALLSARERLHISWVGRSVIDNAERPPSVLVSQLRDHLTACWRLSSTANAPDHALSNTPDKALLAALTVEHRLQAFSPDYFGRDPQSSPLFTYAREWERKTASTSAPSVSIRQSKERLPPPVFDSPIALAQLIRFLKDPVKTFFQERLGVHYDEHRDSDPTGGDHEPFAIAGLDEWTLQDRLIQTRLDALHQGRPEQDAVAQQLARIHRRGELPLGGMAGLVRADLVEPLDTMFAQYAETLNQWPEPLPDFTFAHALGVGGDDAQNVTVRGCIGQRHANGSERCRIELCSSNLIEEKRYRKDKLLAAWALHLAGHLDGQPLTTLLIGKNGRVRLAPLDPQIARQHFDALVAAYVEGLRAPLPLAVKSGFTWLEHNNDPKQESAARNAYEGGEYAQGEISHNPYLQRAYPDFERLRADGRFGELCTQLLAPLMQSIGTFGADR